ncbi:MAG: DUF1028 domain-containing protein [Gemmatimonadota bacterium]
MKVSRWVITAIVAALLPAGTRAQGTEDPIPGGLYEFVPEQSEEIDGKIDDAVSHMNFLIRGIASRRLRGANRSIEHIDIRYSGDSVWISLRQDEPWVVSLRNGEYVPYRRADGEVVQVKTDLSPGVIDQYFQSDDGEKQMIYRLREDGLLELESIVYSEKLEEPFRYTWVYRRVSRDPESGEADGGGRAAAPSAVRNLGRPVHTYSIVARDAGTGELGVAVQSHWFSVGPLVAWAEPGVGAVATQSFVDPSYGPLGLRLMRAGKTAAQALDALLAADDHPEVRQVGMVDAAGVSASHTGDQAIQAAGHVTGDGYAVQANLMVGPSVPVAMARAYDTTDGDLTERLLSALEAAQAEGGDIRGRQSAAILVVSGDTLLNPWEGRLVDLRVEDHPEPVVELRRLVTLSRAYARMNAGDEALTEGDVERALTEYSAAQEMVPDAASNGEMSFWHAVTLASLGRVEESLPLFRLAYAQDENWRILVPRLVDAGQFPDDEALVERVTSP